MKLSTRKYALLAGWSLVVMALAAGFVYGYVYSSLVLPDSPQVTLENISSSRALYMGGLAGWMLIFLLDLLAAWGLYQFLKEVNPRLALVTAMVRAIYALILGAALLHLFSVVNLLGDSPSATQVMNELKAFETIWSFGLILFGLHLLGLGVLTLRATTIPNLWGMLLLFAGLCYSGIHLAKAVAPMHLDQIVRIEILLSLPMAVAEIGFAIWLLLKGGKKNVLLIKPS